MKDIEYLKVLASDLDEASRFGSEKDIPEGGRYIRISDTLAKTISRDLLEIYESLRAAV